MTMITDRIRDESLGIQWRTFRSPLRPVAIAAIVGDLVTTLLVWLERARERRQLLALSDHALQDFGASRADAVCEGDKPFWRA
jgi:uncharacterized protein YjiS (DUF1127 family)